MNLLNKKCDLVLFEMDGCRPQWIYLCSNTHQTGGDVTNSKNSLLALLFAKGDGGDVLFDVPQYQFSIFWAVRLICVLISKNKQIRRVIDL